MTRCAARTRTATGWARCHGQDEHGGAHHSSDRTWPPLRFAICDCADDDLFSYFGGVPISHPGASKSAWPTLWKASK